MCQPRTTDSDMSTTTMKLGYCCAAAPRKLCAQTAVSSLVGLGSTQLSARSAALPTACARACESDQI